MTPYPAATTFPVAPQTTASPSFRASLPHPDGRRPVPLQAGTFRRPHPLRSRSRRSSAVFARRVRRTRSLLSTGSPSSTDRRFPGARARAPWRRSRPPPVRRGAGTRLSGQRGGPPGALPRRAAPSLSARWWAASSPAQSRSLHSAPRRPALSPPASGPRTTPARSQSVRWRSETVPCRQRTQLRSPDVGPAGLSAEVDGLPPPRRPPRRYPWSAGSRRAGGARRPQEGTPWARPSRADSHACAPLRRTLGPKRAGQGEGARGPAHGARVQSPSRRPG